MKNLNEMAAGFKNKPAAVKPHFVAQVLDQSSAKIIDRVFSQLASIFPAWRVAWKNDQDIANAKMEWAKAFAENNINTIDQLRIGFGEARKCDRDFLPSCGKFISWCLNDKLITQGFDRMIRGESPADDIEFNTRITCGYQCKRELSEMAARSLFSKVYKEFRARVAAGEFIASKDQLRLNSKSVVTDLDREISERVHLVKSPIEIRMEKIRKKAAKK